MHFSVKTAATAVLFATSTHAAHAGSIDALNLLGNYNLITSGDVTSSSEVDGNALIGGDLFGGGNYHTHNTPTGVSALTVGGNIQAGANTNVNGSGLNVGGGISGTVNLNGGGDAYVGSVTSGGALQNNANGHGSSYVIANIAGNVNTNGGNTIYGGTLTGSAGANGGGSVQHLSVTAPFSPASQAASAIATLSGFSAELSSIAANSDYSFAGSKVTFNPVANSNGLAIFEISDANSFFDTAGEFQFNLASGIQSILFNVINSDINTILNIHANFLDSAATKLGSKILWNFENASRIDINAQFGGSLLAMDSDVKTYQNVEGSLVAKTLIQGAEIHYQALSTTADDFPSTQNSSIAATVPLPGTIPLLAIGFAGLGSARRNRQPRL